MARLAACPTAAAAAALLLLLLQPGRHQQRSTARIQVRHRPLQRHHTRRQGRHGGLARPRQGRLLGRGRRPQGPPPRQVGGEGVAVGGQAGVDAAGQVGVGDGVGEVGRAGGGRVGGGPVGLC